jgi:prepilin-type N-terminal cleavage/methylation domain-containing protein
MKPIVKTMIGRSSEAGFTVTELLVVISVGSILIGYCLAMILFVLKFSVAWQRSSAIDDKLDAANRRMAVDFEHSLKSDSLGAAGYTIIGPGRDSIHYVCTSSGLRRNGWPVTTDSTLTVEFLPRQGGRTLLLKVSVPSNQKRREGVVSRRESSASLFVAGMAGAGSR